MTAWEMQAQRDRKYFKSILAARGIEGLKQAMLESLNRQAERPRLDVQVSRGRAVASSAVADHTARFAFLRFPFRRTLFLVCLATLMIPFEVTFITNLTTVTSLGWFNTYQGLALPFLATGFGIFLLRQAFLQIPRDLKEAARLDGYGHWRFMARVAVPLARPSVAALTVFAFLAAWNQYLWPLVVTGPRGTSPPLDTVQIGLKELIGTQANNVNVALAGAIIALLPLVVLLLIFQKQLVRSLTAGAVK